MIDMLLMVGRTQKAEKSRFDQFTKFELREAYIIYFQKRGEFYI